MLDNILKLIEDKSPGAIPLFIAIRGSHAYGTNIETSDMDYAGIFIQKMDDILGYNYTPQISDDKNDIVIYEIQRFLDLLYTNNPNIIELLNTPEDCILYKDDIMNLVFDNKDQFITKLCANSFAGYARSQIVKAKGLNKKQNYEKDKVVRKTPLDFCYIHLNGKSTNLKTYLDDNNLDQSKCGLTKVLHNKDSYFLYYDEYSNFKFKGISFENSNDIRLSSIPIELKSLAIISYNKDGYSEHCKDFREYEEWLTNRNEARYVDVVGHNQKIDGKNLMHCQRLIDMSDEISRGVGVCVRRKDKDKLLDIRKGKVDLNSLIDKIEIQISNIYDQFKTSDLPDKIDFVFINDLLIKIRKNKYKL